jgi:hypothetical protein
VKLGHEVEIITLHPDFKNLPTRNFSIEGVKVSYVAQMHIKKVDNIKKYYTPYQLAKIVSKATWNLTTHTLKSKPDIIHIGKPHPMNSIAALLHKFWRGTPLILDCDDYEVASGNFQNTIEKKTVEFFEKKIPGKVSLITTNTFFMQRKLVTPVIVEMVALMVVINVLIFQLLHPLIMQILIILVIVAMVALILIIFVLTLHILMQI